MSEDRISRAESNLVVDEIMKETFENSVEKVIHPEILRLQQKNKALQAKNDALVARVASLKSAIADFNSDFSDAKNIEQLQQSMKKLAEVFIETESESLAEIKAAAFKEAAPTSEMKAACIGEFTFTLEDQNCCPICWSNGRDENCELCGGEVNENGMGALLVTVPWDVQKQIWKRMNKAYANQLRKQGKE